MPEPLTITISEEASARVQQFREVEGKPNAHLRVGVKGGGCAGLTYVLELAEIPLPDDKVIRGHSVNLYIDKKSYVFLAGTTLEYSEGLNGRGFIFNNPNAKTMCGCGTSFSI
ncbi:hypothetical protein LCGC14_0265030 [marine sediment metagenome]|uniref:Core domain-containing protein n=1 Tax=marine sediment metagenome TaxID=412755 RepID=A0A0F9U132_9ZZZZ